MKDIVPLEKYLKVLTLQNEINAELKLLFEQNMHKGREHLSGLLADSIDALVNRLNSEGESFGPCSYGGDMDFENSEQAWSDGKTKGKGVMLNFVGFSCQVTWEGSDKYAESK
jgi:hypothetical protein